MVVDNFMFIMLVSFNALNMGCSGSNEPRKQRDLPLTAKSCEETFAKAISLNERIKHSLPSASLQQQRDLRLEYEDYYDNALVRHISTCAKRAKNNIVLSKLLFELAYSYSDSADEIIPIELARYYSDDQEMARNILVKYEINKRKLLIEILRNGLDNLYYDKIVTLSQLSLLKKSLNELESK